MNCRTRMQDGRRPARRAARWGLGALAVALLLFAAPLSGQVAEGLTEEQTRTANAAMSQLRSPVTPFHTVDMCPSVPELRDSIRVMAAAGWTTDQIVEDVISRHGEQLRLLPKSRGAGLLAWVATPLVILLGAGLIVARLRSGQRQAPPPAAVASLSEAERQRVAAALREWDETGQAGEVDP